MEKDVDEEVDVVVLDEARPMQIIWIGTKLTAETMKNIIAFLKERKYCFTWYISNMLGIDTEVITHKLNVDPKFKPVKQKIRKNFLKRKKSSPMKLIDFKTAV